MTEDCADQRYYTATAGRFYTPDPAGVGAVDLQNPTTWNMYAYSNDDPIHGYDPYGLWECNPETLCLPPGPPILFPGGDGGNSQIQRAKGAGPPATAAALFMIDVLALRADARNFAGALLSGSLPTPCATDIANLGITPEQWANALNNVSVQMGPGSTYPLASTMQSGSAEWQVAVDRHLVVGDQFRGGGTSITVAWSNLNGNQVWINPTYVNPGDVLGSSALMAHETLHNLGLVDTTIQSRLGIAVNGSDTVNISDKLQTDCLPGISGPSVLP